MNKLSKLRHVVLPAIIAIATGLAIMEESLAAETNSSQVLVTFQFTGTASSMPQHLGLATQDNIIALRMWLESHREVRERVITNIVSELDARNLRAVLNNPSFREMRMRAEPSGDPLPRYIVRVADSTNTYYFVLYFNQKGVDTLSAFESALTGEAARSLRLIRRRMALYQVDTPTKSPVVPK